VETESAQDDAERAERARTFIYANARRVDRAAYEVAFDGASAGTLGSAIDAYRNADGGFGHALEPDLRTPHSQPLHTEAGLALLRDAGVRRPDVATECCRYLASVATPDCALPAFVSGALDYPAAPHWQSGFGSVPTLDRTLGAVALLTWHGAEHAWLQQATQRCLQHLETANIDEAHHLRYAFDAAVVLMDAGSRLALLQRLRRALAGAQFFVEDTPVTRYGLTPLHFAPHPNSAARAVFDDALFERHLDDLLESQCADGGWPIRFQSAGEGAAIEWRGSVTLEALLRLRAWGRL
jgi:hypothetical protein